MDYLARREHSFYELMQKLKKKFPNTEAELLREVADALRAQNLQSDERFAESFVRYRISRGFAYLHIKADLSARQVSETLIDKYLAPDEAHWQQAADQLVVKKLGDSEQMSFGSKQHLKISRFLQSRGFLPLQIRRALEKHLD
ncbi:MAG: regulatory protein RecX [Pseudohongiellaceae bacterium]